MSLPLWRALVRLARYKAALYLASGLMASFVFYLIPLLPGLVLRRLFDQLTGDAQISISPFVLLALLVAIALGRVAGILAAVLAETATQVVAATLQRANLLAHVLRRPGAKALPASAGEAISRLRDDVDAVVGFLT